MSECEHKYTEINTYQHEYYGRWFLIEVNSCLECGEILEEKTMDMKVYR